MKQRDLRPSLRAVVATTLLCLGLPAASFGQAEVRMKNGSILYGEVKKVEFAKLTLDTDDFGLIEIDWDPIDYVEAPGPFVINLTDGRALRGAVVIDSVNVTISGMNNEVVPKDMVGSLNDFDVGFWNRLSFGIDIGANVVRGNNQVTSLSSGYNLSWGSDKLEVYSNGSTILNEQEDADDTRRYTANLGFDREMIKRMRLGLVASYERDENQELDYRAPVMVYLSGRVVEKLRSRLDLIVGGGPTFEKFAGEEATNLAEGRVGFAFIGRPNGDTELDFSSYVFPGLFDFDRVRVESDLVFRIEIIDDLTINFTTYYRFNDTPPEGVEKSDYGFTIGFGWSY